MSGPAEERIDADAFAALIADWCLEVRPGQQILIETTTLALAPAVALQAALRERDAWPLLRLSPPYAEADLYRHVHARQLDQVAPLDLHAVRHADASVRIAAPADVRALAEVDPGRVARRSRALEPLRAARRRWCLTLWPTAALAEQAGMSEPQYTAFVRGALFLDQPDPVAAWVALSARQQALTRRLDSAREVRIQAERTDLRLSVAGRRWVNSDGRRNMPSGEVFTGPLEYSANGVIHFDVPSLSRGAEVRGVDLRFSDGAVVEAHAEVGDGLLQAALGTDSGSRLLGELGIGTNTGIYQPTGSTLLDEKLAGTVHLALGNSYPETGGTNSSALHWDLIRDLRQGGTLTLDGEVLIKDGVLME